MKMMDKIKQNENGFSAVEIAFILVVIAGLCLSGYLLFSSQKTAKQSPSNTSTSTSNTSTKSTNSAYKVLSPATVPSKTAECNQQISFSSNGDSGPITCNDGSLNVTEWNSLAALEPSVMTLGYGVTVTQVQSALCADVKENISNAIEATTYQISALYYGWNFSENPTTVITNGTCVNVDD
jgi:hypothetical protein